MRNGFRGFLIGLVLTLVVLSPFVWCVLLWARGLNPTEPAAQSQTTLRVEPGAQTEFALLLAVAPVGEEEPAFLLVRLSGPERKIRLCEVPGETVLLRSGQAVTLTESYRAAGPARCAELLAETLVLPRPHYLAATAELWNRLWGNALARVDISSLLSMEQREGLGLGEAILSLTPSTGEELAAQMCGLPGGRAAADSLRAALWDALFRQNPEALSGLADRVRAKSGSILTDLTATDLIRLEELCTRLSGEEKEVESGVLPGNRRPAGYELNSASSEAAERILKF